MALDHLADLTLIVAPIEAGKTLLIKYLLLSNVQHFACVFLFSNTGLDSYNENYNFLNKLYIADEFKAEDLDKLLKLAKKIRSNDPTRRLCVIFDDSVGMAKGLFSGSKAKRLLTTLRHYGISVIVSTQQLQNEVTTLLRNNIQEVFLFAQSEPYGLQLAYDTWGKSSSNLKDKSEFEKSVFLLCPDITFCTIQEKLSYGLRDKYLIHYPNSASIYIQVTLKLKKKG